MTTDKARKRAVRSRMQKTGERYAAARRHVVHDGDGRRTRRLPPLPPRVADPGVSEAASARAPVRAGTTGSASSTTGTPHRAPTRRSPGTYGASRRRRLVGAVGHGRLRTCRGMRAKHETTRGSRSASRRPWRSRPWTPGARSSSRARRARWLDLALRMRTGTRTMGRSARLMCPPRARRVNVYLIPKGDDRTDRDGHPRQARGRGRRGRSPDRVERAATGWPPKPLPEARAELRTGAASSRSNPALSRRLEPSVQRSRSQTRVTRSTHRAPSRLRRFVVGAVLRRRRRGVTTAAIATDTFGAGERWISLVGRVERFLAGPVPDRATLQTVLRDRAARDRATDARTRARAGQSGSGRFAGPDSRTHTELTDAGAQAGRLRHRPDPDKVFGSQTPQGLVRPGRRPDRAGHSGKLDTSDQTQIDVASRVRHWEAYDDSHNGDWARPRSPSPLIPMAPPATR